METPSIQRNLSVLADERESVRVCAALALAMIEPRSGAAEGVLVRAESDKSAPVAEAATFALRWMRVP
jgi:hypothetical protein